jgi:hypothetical protein
MALVERELSHERMHHLFRFCSSRAWRRRMRRVDLRSAIRRFSLLETKYLFFFTSFRMPSFITVLLNLRTRLSCDSPGRNSTFGTVILPPVLVLPTLTPPRRFPSNAVADGRPTMSFSVICLPAKSGPGQPPLCEHRFRREPGSQRGSV